jgi:hypothetical protein
MEWSGEEGENQFVREWCDAGSNFSVNVVVLL